ncbi:hypothetical protein DFJ74DRAFT_705759 [Hyaloraphidium curvatum]|nr:hypothetical protein DFJ74DRAFT_705759 [Hyaloraphidium curvatum]
MKQPVVDSTPKRIEQIEFGALSAAELSQLSVVSITQRDLFDISQAGRPPLAYGALDKRLGISSKAGNCETCKLQLKDCVGHFGQLRLALPVFHIGYFRLVIQILQNVCKSCARILVEERDRRTYLRRLRQPNIDGVQRGAILKSLNALCKKVTKCPHCDEFNGMVKKVSPMRLVHERYKATRKAQEDDIKAFRATFDAAVEMQPDMKYHISKAQDDLDPVRVLTLFQQISDEDCELLGLDPSHGRPEEFIWTSLPVPPVCIRPSVGQDGASNEDDITVLLSDIVTVNARIRNSLKDGGDMKLLMEHWDFLQLQCAMFVNADLPGVANTPTMLNRIKRGFCQRLKGKQGRFRGNLSGKRVDFSGRTVISPDPNLRIDEVAVPVHVAKTLTYPEQVTVHNIERLRAAVRNGIDVHPGANYVKKADGGKFSNMYLKFGDRKATAANLKPGDLVERHLIDGDIVLFNRQPSLHKLSIMSHFVKVRPWRTFRLNECACTPYNADFDGDEMNLHVPQTEEARAEARELMGVKQNLVTPRNGEPLIAAIQDFITASYLMTRRDVFFNRAQIAEYCTYMGDAVTHIDLPPPAILKPQRLWTGKQLFSLVLKPNRKSNVNVNLSTRNRTFEKGHGMAEFDEADGWVIIQNSQLLCGTIDKSLIGAESKNSVFYTILRDYSPEDAAGAMNRLAKTCARWLANRGFSIGIEDVQPGAVLSVKKDQVVEKGYTDCDDVIEKSRKGQLENQPGCDAEQTLEAKISGILSKIRDDVGQICLQELNKYNAPLIMSLCGSKGSKINVSQMVACVGQQIISGQRIPNGFPDRSLPHFGKHSKIPAAKGFVRNSFYSGLTPSEFLFHAVSGREGLVDTAVKTAETGYMQRRLMKALEDLTTAYDSSVRNSTSGVVQLTYGDDGLDPSFMEGDKQPVHFPRLLAHCQNVLPCFGEPGLLPFEIRELVAEGILEPTFSKCSRAFVEQVTQFVEKHIVQKLGRVRGVFGLAKCLEGEENAGTAAERLGRRRSLGQIQADNTFRVTKQQLEMFLDTCWRKYMKARIEPGTAVGAVGAQSIGEPGTQMTLKTFHFAGVASMNITLGVPRIKEIINASKAISTPIITAELLSSNPRDTIPARIVKGRIEKTLLEDIAKSIQIIIKPGDCFVKITLDMDAIQKLRLEVDLQSIQQAILNAPKLKITESFINAYDPNVITVMLPPNEKDPFSVGVLRDLHALKRVLPKVIVKGIPSVNRAVINEEDGRLKLLVEGYGLREVMNMEGVEGERTTSNHILEVNKVLGIEAARATIINEIQYTMGKHGMTIDPRHVMLLGDLMTYRGEVLGITRFGIAKMKDSVLMLASFEKTTDHLFEAAFYGKKDRIDGVSECIIMGVPMMIGTGLPKLIQVSRADTLVMRKLIFDPNA